MSPSDSPDRDSARPSSDEHATEPVPSTPPSPPRWSKSMRRPMFDLTRERKAELLAQSYQREAVGGRRHNEEARGDGLDDGQVTVVGRRPHRVQRADDLPHYLGFGWLDRDSVRVDGDRLAAEYRAEEGDVAYRVEREAQGWTIEEFVDGKRVSSSRGRALTLAATQLAVSGSGSIVRWQRLAARLSRNAFVLLHREEEAVLGASPALLLADLRLIDNGTLRRPLPVISLDPPGTAPTTSDGGVGPFAMAGAIVRRWADDSLTVERVGLIDYRFPAIVAERALHEVEIAGYRWTLKEHRPVVSISSPLPPAWAGYTGDPTRGLRNFAVVGGWLARDLDEAIERAAEQLRRWEPPS